MYPDDIYSPRAKANRSGVVYNPAKETVLYVEDVVSLDEHIVALEETLGLDPQGEYDSVADRLDNLIANSPHSDLQNLDWLLSGHIGTPNAIPIFDNVGVSEEFIGEQESILFFNNNGELDQDNTNFGYNKESSILRLGPVGGFSDIPTKLSNPANLPSGTGRASSFSSNGLYLAVAHDTTPFITIYKRSGDTFTKLSDTADLPASAGNDIVFSPDDKYLAVAHDTTPFITIYKRSGDTFTKLSNPATLPGGAGKKVDFSYDGQYLSIAHSNTPYFTIYKRSGDTFTKLSNPTPTPSSNGTGVVFSQSGAYFVASESTSPYINIYKKSGDTFNRLSNPSSLPTGSSRSGAFSPDGKFLVIPHDTTPFITIYKRSGDTFTKLSDPADLPASNGYAVIFSPDSKYLSVAHNTTPFVTIYSISGDVFTKITNPSNLPTGNSRGATFSPDGTYMAITHLVTPFITIYKGEGTATHRFEIAYASGDQNTTHLDGYSLGKDISLYRQTAGILGLFSGTSLTVESGQILIGNNSGDELPLTYNTILDSIGNGIFSGNIGIGDTELLHKLSVRNGNIALVNDSVEGELRFYEPSAQGSNYCGIKAPAQIANNIVWKLPKADGIDRQLIQTDGNGQLSFVDKISSYADMYISTPVATTITTGNTFQKLSGTTAVTALYNWTHTPSNRLNYTGSNNALILINVSFSVYGNFANDDIQLRLAVNGTTISRSNIKLDQTDDLDNYTGSMTLLVLMNQNDYIELWGTTQTSGKQITLDDMLITAIQLN